MGTALYIDDFKDDVRRRLNGSICRFKGEPMVVTHTAGVMVTLKNMTNGIKIVVDHRDSDFDYRSPPLGYVNYSPRALYLYRVPSRDNAKSGLAPENMGCEEGDPIYIWGRKELRDCIMGEHPTLREAMERLESGDWTSCAFHRHLAISQLGRSGLSLLHRGRVIAIRESGRFKLLEGQDNSFLSRILSKAGVPH